MSELHDVAEDRRIKVWLIGGGEFDGFVCTDDSDGHMVLAQANHPHSYFHVPYANVVAWLDVRDLNGDFVMRR